MSVPGWAPNRGGGHACRERHASMQRLTVLSVCCKKADVMCCIIAVIIFAYLGFARPHALASHAPVMYGVTMSLMLLLLAAAWATPRLCSPQALW